MENIDSQIEALTEQIKSLQREKLALENDPIANSPQGKLAVYLHDKFCCGDHADGCSWHYEIHRDGSPTEWDGWAHSRWRQNATDVLAEVRKLKLVV